MKRVDLVGRANAEFRVDALNVFNHVNFIPVSGITIPTAANDAGLNRTSGSNPVTYEVQQLAGTTNTNTARIVLLVTRIRW